jgi:hypothetical protein
MHFNHRREPHRKIISGEYALLRLVFCFSAQELFTFHEAFFNASRTNQRA